MKFNTHKNIYKLKHALSNEEEKKLLSEMREDLKMETYEFVQKVRYCDFSSTVSDVSLVIMDSHEFQEFLKISEKTGMIYEIEDITESTILGEFEFDSDVYDYLIVPYLESNIDADTVLDKILIKGIESLSEVDLRILESGR